LTVGWQVEHAKALDACKKVADQLRTLGRNIKRTLEVRECRITRVLQTLAQRPSELARRVAPLAVDRWVTKPAL
jgi:hypothetical protein